MKRKEFYGALTYSDAIEDVAVCVNPNAMEWVKFHLFGQGEFNIEIALIDFDAFDGNDVLYTVPIDEFYMRYAGGYVIEAEGIPCIS